MYNKRKITKILIVDDSDMNRAILADMLNDQYEILEAKSGIEALKLLHAFAEDVQTSISLICLYAMHRNLNFVD